MAPDCILPSWAGYCLSSVVNILEKTDHAIRRLHSVSFKVIMYFPHASSLLLNCFDLCFLHTSLHCIFYFKSSSLLLPVSDITRMTVSWQASIGFISLWTKMAVAHQAITHWLLRDVEMMLQVTFSNSIYKLISWALHLKLVSGECHRMILPVFYCFYHMFLLFVCILALSEMTK